MQWVTDLKAAMPEYAKDTKLNIDAVILRSTLDEAVASGCALAAAMASGNGKLVNFIAQSFDNEIEKNAALSAAAIMAQTNIWYPFVEMAGDPSLSGLPAQLRMNAVASHGGTSKENFEAYALAASIVGGCHFCVKSHYHGLKEAGYTVEQLRDVGRIAAVMNSVAKVLVG